jgi:hypothetical protein
MYYELERKKNTDSRFEFEFLKHKKNELDSFIYLSFIY